MQSPPYSCLQIRLLDPKEKKCRDQENDLLWFSLRENVWLNSFCLQTFDTQDPTLSSLLESWNNNIQEFSFHFSKYFCFLFYYFSFNLTWSYQDKKECRQGMRFSLWKKPDISRTTLLHLNFSDCYFNFFIFSRLVSRRYGSGFSTFDDGPSPAPKEHAT